MQDRAGAPGVGSPIDAAEVRTLLDGVARPRMTGSHGAAEVEAGIRRRFDALGYGLRELPFAFSSLPGRYGLPMAGAISMVMAAAAGWLMEGGQATLALAVLAGGMILAATPLLFLDRALRLPWGRIETANLLFTRDTPRWIVMAHRDTKSQGVPTAVRTLVIALAVTAWLTLVALTAVNAAGQSTGQGAGHAALAGLRWGATGTLLVAGAVLTFAPSGNASPGALDNGTGLAAMLALAERVPPDVAFLVTDGEELGLAGARAAVDRLPRVGGIINLDGLDDDGPIRIAEGRADRRREAAGAVATALLAEARALGLEAVRRPLPPFVLVDHEPLAAAGRPALTLLKGRWRSLHRIHRPADSVDRLDGTGAAEVASLVLAALGGLTTDHSDTLRPDERSGHSPVL